MGKFKPRHPLATCCMFSFSGGCCLGYWGCGSESNLYPLQLFHLSSSEWILPCWESLLSYGLPATYKSIINMIYRAVSSLLPRCNLVHAPSESLQVLRPRCSPSIQWTRFTLDLTWFLTVSVIPALPLTPLQISFPYGLESLCPQSSILCPLLPLPLTPGDLITPPPPHWKSLHIPHLRPIFYPTFLFSSALETLLPLTVLPRIFSTRGNASPRLIPPPDARYPPFSHPYIHWPLQHVKAQIPQVSPSRLLALSEAHIPSFLAYSNSP